MFQEYLIQQINSHTSMQPQDIVKLCFQAAFGAEHLLADTEAARNYFYAEYKSIPVKDEPLYERISENICRINLSAWKASGMDGEWLFRMFVHTAAVPGGSKELFMEYLEAAEGTIECLKRNDANETGKRQTISFTVKNWQEYLKQYKETGMPSVHHSDSYREQEKPAYRIVNSRFLKILPVLQEIVAQNHVMQEQKNKETAEKAKVIAIDGRAASGKTTMAGLLEKVLDAGVIHLDDFFLPPVLRSAERFAQPGGNVHYERFAEEVLPFLSREEEFSYRFFDCSKMELAGRRTVPESRWRVVEGSYSLHPYFGDYADVKIFSDVEPDEQMRRILARNGEKMAEMFRDRWIPMEESYFEGCHVKDRADLMIVSGIIAMLP